jgi:5-methylcytosine-specific restriction endonuclease McrA
VKSKRSKACDISKAVKDAVWERDGGRCIICGSYQAMPNSHYIKRSRGGLGIEENITTMCFRCHDDFDGKKRLALKPFVAAYLSDKYDGWSEDKLIYKKT